MGFWFCSFWVWLRWAVETSQKGKEREEKVNLLSFLMFFNLCFLLILSFVVVVLINLQELAGKGDTESTVEVGLLQSFY